MTKIKLIYLKDEYRFTTDEWYPNYTNNQVRLRVGSLSNGSWRVSVWGADDFGMEFDLKTRHQALMIYQELPSIITIKHLEQIGFVPA